jgi:uncharacterized protein YodC (DUF2158 family)
MDEIKAGDVVYLKSDDSHPMTVDVDAYTAGSVVCFWFNGNELRTGVFHKTSLRKSGTR